MHCPTRAEVLASVLSLLPRGRAWANNEGGPEPYRDAPFSPKIFDPEVFDTDSRVGTVLYRFWEAYATVLHYFNERLCALRLEMFCATMSETRDQWMAEYGLPDACDPFPDICAKVAALGGSRCEYFQEIVSRAGWSITCDDGVSDCGDQMGCAQMGCAQASTSRRNSLRIIVDLDESPAFGGVLQTPPLMGLVQMGQPIACDPDISPLQCLMDRIAPAHVSVSYLTN